MMRPPDAPLYISTRILGGFLAGDVSREDAMRCLQMSSCSEPLNALAGRVIPLPKPSAEQVETELAGAMPILPMMEAARHDA